MVSVPPTCHESMPVWMRYPSAHGEEETELVDAILENAIEDQEGVLFESATGERRRGAEEDDDADAGDIEEVCTAVALTFPTHKF